MINVSPGDFIDVHTHSRGDGRGKLEIVNLFSTDEIPGSGAFCSIGFHPWQLKDGMPGWEALEEKANAENVMAIGECGLDKAIDISFDMQHNVFARQVLIAEKIEKPLIIHCVKAYSEILQLHKQIEPSYPWIIHGFQSSADMAGKFTGRGIYLSFGEGLFKSTKVQEALKVCPLDKMLLETDESGLSIDEVYQKAAEVLEKPLQEIKKAIQANFNHVFNP